MVPRGANGLADHKMVSMSIESAAAFAAFPRFFFFNSETSRLPVSNLYPQITSAMSRILGHHQPFIPTSSSSSSSASNALLIAFILACSNFRAFFPLTGANGPLVGCRTLLIAVPLGFLDILLMAFFFCTLRREETRRDLLGTLGLPLEGIFA